MRRLRRRRRVAAQNNARLRAFGLRSLGDKLYKISKFLVENEADIDEDRELLDTISVLEETIDDNIYALKSELTS